MNNVCKNCRFWIPPLNGTLDPGFKGKCDNEDESMRELHVRVYDDSGLEAKLLTRPHFGCTLFEAGQHYSLRDYDDDVLDGED